MNKVKRNYYVDTVIGIMFLAVTVSAVVFLIPTSWIDFSTSTTPTVLGLNFGIWQTIHKWAGIAMLIGIAVHQLLHWDWIVVMTKRMMPGLSLPQSKRGSSFPADMA